MSEHLNAVKRTAFYKATRALYAGRAEVASS